MQVNRILEHPVAAKQRQRSLLDMRVTGVLKPLGRIAIMLLAVMYDFSFFTCCMAYFPHTLDYCMTAQNIMLFSILSTVFSSFL
jgi:hypothetical protein